MSTSHISVDVVLTVGPCNPTADFHRDKTVTAASISGRTEPAGSISKMLFSYLQKKLLICQGAMTACEDKQLIRNTVVAKIGLTVIVSHHSST